MFHCQETQRISLYELFETETIKASVLRYKLQYLPGDILSELTGNNTNYTVNTVTKLKPPPLCT